MQIMYLLYMYRYHNIMCMCTYIYKALCVPM